MLTPADFLEATRWSAILTVAIALISGLAFLFKWGLRFRLVGATGFMLVLTFGLFGLSIVPITRTVIPGAIRYATVYDSGAAQVVIKVPTTITQSELQATLQQAAANLFTPGRLGQAGQSPMIRARTMVHPEPGVSQLIYLGQVERSPGASFNADVDEKFQVKLYPEGLAQLPPAS